MVTKPAHMREPTYFILAALQDEPLYGYAIIKRAEALSQGRVILATGTLYSALDRLTAEGCVKVVNEEIVNGRARRYYATTPDGDAALRAEPLTWPTPHGWSPAAPLGWRADWQ